MNLGYIAAQSLEGFCLDSWHPGQWQRKRVWPAIQQCTNVSVSCCASEVQGLMTKLGILGSAEVGRASTLMPDNLGQFKANRPGLQYSIVQVLMCPAVYVWATREMLLVVKLGKYCSLMIGRFWSWCLRRKTKARQGKKVRSAIQLALLRVQHNCSFLLGDVCGHRPEIACPHSV